MRDGWQQVNLGEVATRRTDFTLVDPHETYTILGVQRSGWGFVRREPLLGSAMKFTKLLQLNTNDLVYRTITAFEAPSAVAGPDEAGYFVTPQTFPVFHIDQTRLLPEYMSLMTTYPGFHEEMSSRCTGTVLRRKTLSVGAFESIPILLPPLVEQRRIVDLIGSIDNAIAARDGVNVRIRRLLGALSNALPGETEDLDRLLLSIEGGRSPAGVERQPNPGERAVLKVSAIGPDGFDPTEVKVVPQDVYLPPHSAVSRGDVLMVRANGVLNRVGVVCWVPEDYPQLYLCDKTLRLVPNASLLSSTWMTAALSSRDARKQIESLTTGSHMRNIGQTAIRKIRIPAPPLPVQEEYAKVLTILNKTLELGAETLRQFRGVRSDLLTDLLAGEHEIPESYDELIREVA